MPSRNVLTIVTTAGLTAMYFAYALLLGPLLRPPDMDQLRVQYTGAQEPPSTVDRDVAETWLPDHPWAATAPKHFSNDSFTVYAQEMEQIDNNKAVRFTPFAMVWFNEKDNDPIRMYADSAVLRFDRPLDPLHSQFGRPIAGQLEAKVEIRGPDGLWVSGRNFSFQESAMHILSDNAVVMRYGPHDATATGIQINLLPAQNRTDENAPMVGGIKSVRLLRNVEMNLMVEEGTKEGIEEQFTPVIISSDGSFTYTFETAKANFEENVRVKRPTGPDQNDVLERCDELTVLFDNRPLADDGTPIADTRPTNPDEFKIDPPHDVIWLKAKGRNISLRSDENELSASEITEVDYYKVQRVAVLSGIPQQVEVNQAGTQLISSQIRLEHDEGGKLISAYCPGYGELKHHDLEAGEQLLEARWNGYLSISPDPENPTQDVIEFSRDVKLMQRSRKTALAADLIKLWVMRAESGELASRPGASISGAEKIVPKRLLARENVALVSPELDGQAHQLAIWFQQGQLPATWGTAESSPNGTPAQTASLANDASASSSPSSQTSPGRLGRPSAAERDSGEPAVVSADLIRVNVIQPPGDADPVVERVWADGNVDIRQNHAPPEQPLHVIGERLRLENQGEYKQHLVVYGSPAWIEDREANITGKEIHFDRERNVIVIHGEGILQLPVRNDMDGRELEHPSTLDVRWKERMEFNGKQASFFGGVVAVLFDDATRRQNNRMTCEEMQVSLTERVSFSEEADQRKQVDVENIFCVDGVNYSGYTYEGEQLIGVRKAEFFEFSVSPVTGETFARGGGKLWFWQHSQGKNSALAPEAVVRANRPLKSETSEWSYTRVRFAGDMDGNLNQQKVTFRDQVNVLHGPVERPQETLDEDHLPNGAGWMRCNLLNLYQVGPKDAQQVELQAIGNVLMQGKAIVPEAGGGAGNAQQGRNFEAQADTITYDSMKQLFTLWARGTRRGTIRYQKSPGANPNLTNFEKALYIPSRNHLEVDGSTILQGME